MVDRGVDFIFLRHEEFAKNKHCGRRRICINWNKISLKEMRRGAFDSSEGEGGLQGTSV